MFEKLLNLLGRFGFHLTWAVALAAAFMSNAGDDIRYTFVAVGLVAVYYIEILCMSYVKSRPVKLYSTGLIFSCIYGKRIAKYTLARDGRLYWYAESCDRWCLAKKTMENVLCHGGCHAPVMVKPFKMELL